jgi:hypothetical protein
MTSAGTGLTVANSLMAVPESRNLTEEYGKDRRSGVAYTERGRPSDPRLVRADSASEQSSTRCHRPGRTGWYRILRAPR